MTEQGGTRPKRKNHEGTFRQLPSGRYEGAKWVKEIGRTVSVTADTEAKARKALNEKVALVSNHQLPARRAKVTFLEYAEGVIAERTKIGQRTRDKYTGDLKLYLKPLHHLRLDDIKPHTLRKLYAGLRAKGLSDTICIHAHVLIRLVLERARTDKIIAMNPADEKDVRPGRERGSRSERAARSFTPAEAARLLEFAPKVLHGEVVAFLLLTGMRRGEAMALRWENVDGARRARRN